MGQRLELHAVLGTILGDLTKVYFQAPPTTQMGYPCIVYDLDDIDTEFANDKPYTHVRRYQVKIIDRNPDSLLPAKVGDLPLCVFDRFYTADQLNHFVYRLYF